MPTEEVREKGRGFMSKMTTEPVTLEIAANLQHIC